MKGMEAMYKTNFRTIARCARTGIAALIFIGMVIAPLIGNAGDFFQGKNIGENAGRKFAYDSLEKAKETIETALPLAGEEIRATLEQLRDELESLGAVYSDLYQDNLRVSVEQLGIVERMTLENTQKAVLTLNMALQNDMKLAGQETRATIEKIANELRETIPMLRESVREVIIVTAESTVYVLDRTTYNVMLIIAFIMLGIGLLSFIKLFFMHQLPQGSIKYLAFGFMATYLLLFGIIAFVPQARAYTMSSIGIGLKKRLANLEQGDVLPPILMPKTFTNSFGMEFVLIPAGTFFMGADPTFEPADPDENPIHKVTISKPFYLGKYEVTQEQWVRVMKKNPESSPEWRGRNYPVNNISKQGVYRFLQQLNDAENTTVYGLPTEAEWEYAARAGSSGIRYFFGDAPEELGTYAWHGANNRTPHEVGLLKPNPWGLYDIYGGAVEWVEDRYDASYYQRSPSVDPLNKWNGEYQALFAVLRGNGHDANMCRSASRYTAGDYGRIYKEFTGRDLEILEEMYGGLRIIMRSIPRTQP